MTFRERRYQYSRLGMRAVLLAKRLRKLNGMPSSHLDNGSCWSVKHVLWTEWRKQRKSRARMACPDNNIAENALRGVGVGRKNWLFAGSDSGGEHAAVLYSLIGTCCLNNVEPEKWLRYVIEYIQDWPANRVRDLLPWKVDLTPQ